MCGINHPGQHRSQMLTNPLSRLRPTAPVFIKSLKLHDLDLEYLPRSIMASIELPSLRGLEISECSSMHMLLKDFENKATVQMESLTIIQMEYKLFLSNIGFPRATRSLCRSFR